MAEKEAAPKRDEPLVVCTYPDFCVKGNAVAAYHIVAVEGRDTRASADVKITEAWASNKLARLDTVEGDGGGDAGVASGTVEGWSRPVADMADSVLINEQPTVRHDTVFEMNAAGPDGPHNTEGRMVYDRGEGDSEAGPAEDEEEADALLHEALADEPVPEVPPEPPPGLETPQEWVDHAIEGGVVPRENIERYARENIYTPSNGYPDGMAYREEMISNYVDAVEWRLADTAMRQELGLPKPRTPGGIVTAIENPGVIIHLYGMSEPPQLQDEALSSLPDAIMDVFKRLRARPIAAGRR